ncbi:MAG: Rpn family recombination-promoting nuclease/putative transposase [Candidatus Cryptobacteroides sp.]
MEKEMRKKASGRYADVVSDAGFKAVFCDKENKDVVRDFLNVFMPPSRKVESFRLMRTELSGKAEYGKTIRIDLRCRTEDGTDIIVEMQNYPQCYFFRRCVGYASRMYESKMKRGMMGVEDYMIPPVYIIAVMNVPLARRKGNFVKRKYVSEYTFREKDTLEVLDETISIIFVELSSFEKSIEECESLADKWCYALKHIGTLAEQPEDLVELQGLFDAAEVAHFNEKKLNEYKEELMREYDYHSRMAYADHQGEERGLAKGLARTAINLKAKGMSFDFILDVTGLTEDELKKILS